MTEQQDTNILANNVGGYVIKIGNAFVASYQRDGLFNLAKNYPLTLMPHLEDVREFLHNKDQAKIIAKCVNGKVYQVCVEPVEDKE